MFKCLSIDNISQFLCFWILHPVVSIMKTVGNNTVPRNRFYSCFFLLCLTAATCFGLYLTIFRRNIQFWILEIITLTMNPLFCILFSVHVLCVAMSTVCFLWQNLNAVNFVDLCDGCYMRCTRKMCVVEVHFTWSPRILCLYYDYTTAPSR
jgi:hypothetical protein